MALVKINDIEVEVPDGTNMIEAARQAGIEIPHYCYHPHLTIAGNCRMCLVDVEAGGRGPDVACNMGARDGLAIRTDTEQVETMRKSVMEFLLVNHPLDCPICDQAGECRLQDYYMDYGQYDSRLVDPKVSKAKRQDIGEHIVLDGERCVACSRCVRFGDEITETGELRLFNRGDHTEIGIFPGERLDHNYQGNLADICPVGALTNKDFRFEKRVWYLKETDSICTGCATGCNIKVCHEQGQVFRFLPRRNDAVNDSWMCDPGRATYTSSGAMNRILRSTVSGERVDLDVAISKVADAIKGAETVGVVLGSQETNEANWALYSALRANGVQPALFHVAGNDPGSIELTDAFLVDADKNPNTAGVKLIGEHAQMGDAEALKAAELDVLIVLGDDVHGRMDGISAAQLIYVGSHTNSTSEASAMVLPAATPVEQEGSYVNKNGRVQRTRRALIPAGDAQPAYRVFDALGAALGTAPGTTQAAGTFAQMAAEIPDLNGMSYATLGDGGQDIAAASAAPPSPANEPEPQPTA